MYQRSAKPKVSVIVPIYNVAPYLRKCIDSIAAQTLTDIEIILVDDGSADGSENICDEYASLDGRITVIHKRNEGLSAARNDGITASSAPYIMFVDGDDWVEPTFCEAPYRIASRYNTDIVLFSYSQSDRRGKIKKIKPQTRQGELSEAEALRVNVYGECFAWVKLYRRELFDTIRYPVGMTHEDVATTHRLIHAARRIYSLDDHLYHYRIDRPGSITAPLNNRSRSDIREMFASKIRDLCSWGYEELARKDALTLLVKYGWRNPEQKPYVEIVKRIKGWGPAEFSTAQKLLAAAFRLSPRAVRPHMRGN